MFASRAHPLYLYSTRVIEREREREREREKGRAIIIVINLAEKPRYLFTFRILYVRLMFDLCSPELSLGRSFVKTLLNIQVRVPAEKMTLLAFFAGF
jgi:hypothetical protein